MNRFLLVGFGSIGKCHLKIIRDSFPCAEIHIYRHNPCQEVPEFANDCISTLEELRAFAPEAAIIANPAPLHAKIARELVDLGCHLLIEKPLSDSEEGVADLLSATKQKGIILQVGYNLRFLPSLRFFQEQIVVGRIGQILSVRCEIGQYLPSWRPGSDYRKSVSAKKELGGGVLLELSHEFDYLRWIFGEVAWVQSWLGKCSDLEVDVEDFASVIMGLRSGFQKREIVATLTMDFFRQDIRRTCLAIGDKGSLSWDALTGKVEEFFPEEGQWKEVFCATTQRNESYRDQWRHFLGCIQTGAEPLVSGKAGLAVLQVVAAVRKSSEAQGMRIPIL